MFDINAVQEPQPEGGYYDYQPGMVKTMLHFTLVMVLYSWGVGR